MVVRYLERGCFHVNYLVLFSSIQPIEFSQVPFLAAFEISSAIPKLFLIVIIIHTSKCVLQHSVSFLPPPLSAQTGPKAHVTSQEMYAGTS